MEGDLITQIFKEEQPTEKSTLSGEGFSLQKLRVKIQAKEEAGELLSKLGGSNINPETQQNN